MDPEQLGFLPSRDWGGGHRGGAEALWPLPRKAEGLWGRIPEAQPPSPGGRIRVA